MKLALGTVQFGLPYGIANQNGQVCQQDAKAILNMAWQRGIDTLDTAVAYGDSEACLGSSETSSFKVITKLPPLPDDCGNVASWVRSQLDSSLARLNRVSVYGLLLHRAEQLIEPRGAELAAALSQLKEEGLVSKIGVSIYSPLELEAATAACHIDLVQAPFNLVDNRLLTSGWMDRLFRSGVEIHTRSAFLQGLLLMVQGTIPSKFSRWSPLWSRFYSWLAMHDTTAIAACLAFPLSFPQISRVVVGVDTLDQFSQLLEAEALALISNDSNSSFPDLTCDDEQLINPSYWSSLESDR